MSERVVLVTGALPASGGQVQRWDLPGGWVISKHPAHAALVREADFIAAQDTNAPRSPAGPAVRRYLLAARMRAVRTAAGIGLVERNARLPVPPRILERHRPDPARLKNTYIREGQILPHPTTLAILLADNGVPGYARQVNTHSPAEIADLIDQLHATGTVLAYEPDTRIIRAGNDTAVAITVGQHS